MDKNTAVILSLLTAQIDPISSNGGGLWRGTIFLILCCCLFLLAKKFYRFIGIELTAWWLYSLTYALFYFEAPIAVFGSLHTAFQATAGQNFAEVLVIPLTVILLGEDACEKALKCFRVIVLYEILAIWFEWPGLMIPAPMAASFDSALIAMFFPFSFIRSPWLNRRTERMHRIWRDLWRLGAYLSLPLASLVTIFSIHGSTALLVLAAQAFVWCAHRCTRKQFIITVSAIFAGLFALAEFHANSPMLDGTERLFLYRKYMDLWLHGPLRDVNWNIIPDRPIVWRNIFIGVGPGTFTWISFYSDGFEGHVWPWLHSTPLQLIWEFGFVGFFLGLATVVRAIRNVFWNTQILGALLGCLACGITYHPDRFGPTILLMCLIFRKALFLPAQDK